VGLKTHSAAGIGGTGHSAPGAVSPVTAQGGHRPGFFAIHALIASTATGGMIVWI